jgi:hypothetical protein
MPDIIFDFNKSFSTEATTKSESMVKVFNSGGKGKKQCQNESCAVYVGVRNRICPVCNTEFIKKEYSIKEASEAPRSAKDLEDSTSLIIKKTNIKTDKDYDSVILIPRGVCPVNLNRKELTRDNIISWAIDVRRWFLDNEKQYLALSAIVYYARTFYNIFSKEYTMIRAILEEWDR